VGGLAYVCQQCHETRVPQQNWTRGRCAKLGRIRDQRRAREKRPLAGDVAIPNRVLVRDVADSRRVGGPRRS